MLNFRKALPQDSDAVSALVNSAYRGDSSKVGWTTEAHLLGGQRTDAGKILELIQDPHGRIEMAFENDELIGLMNLIVEGETLYFGMLTVRPDLQNRGIGKILIQRTEDLARELGLKRVRMTVISQRTELIAFYERRGYTWTGQTEPFPANEPRFGLPKTDLVFLEYVKIL